MHPDVEEAIEQIDAAIFSGDAGGLKGIEHLKGFCERWLRELAKMEECFKEVEQETFEAALAVNDKGLLDSAQVCYEKSEQGKNWVATVEHDKESPGGLSRDFWKRRGTSFVVVPDDLVEDEILEFAADHINRRGMRQRNRKYVRITQVEEDAIYVTEVPKP